MTVEVLVATMHQTDFSILEKMNINTDAVVINQCDTNSEEKIQYNGHDVYWVNTTQRGLSKSRNMALQKARADVCVIADDDLVYHNDCGQIIKDAFFQNTDASLIRFDVRGIEKEYRKYGGKICKVGVAGSLKVASVEIAFKRENIICSGIKFNELIGAGTEFKMGEENTFLFDCLRKRLKIMFVPSVIADLHIGNSTWFTGYNREYLVARGAAFTAMSSAASIALILQWAVRKYSLYKKEFSFISAVTLMLKGRRKYKEKVKEQRQIVSQES